MENHEGSTAVTYCLWFVPPEPHMAQISKQIKSLADINNSANFVPHVTVVGFIQLSKDTDSLVVEELKTAFQNFDDNNGAVCKFDRSKGFVTSYDANNEIVWTQAYVGVVQRDESLIKAIELAKKTLLESKHVVGGEEKLQPIVSFPPPLNEPHLSFIYKKSAVSVLDNMLLPEDFISREMVLVKTEPTTFENIPNWEIVGSIKF